MIIINPNCRREVWKYGERAYRYCHLDVGHTIAAIRVAAAMNGWKVLVFEKLSNDFLCHMLGTNRTGEFHDMEQEEPCILAAIVPGNTGSDQVFRYTIPDSLVTQILKNYSTEHGIWYGKPNTLSWDHFEWKILPAIINATRINSSITQNSGTH